MRILKSEFVDGRWYVEIAGNNTDDSKPTDNICQGSIFTEVDTGDVYLYDEGDGWTKQFSFQA